MRIPGNPTKQAQTLKNRAANGLGICLASPGLPAPRVARSEEGLLGPVTILEERESAEHK